MPRICATTPRDENGRPLKVRDLASATNFIDRLKTLAVNSGKSFTRYMTVNGYSSYATVADQPNQGLVKAAIAELHELKLRALKGDPEAINGLSILGQYLTRDQSTLRASA